MQLLAIEQPQQQRLHQKNDVDVTSKVITISCWISSSTSRWRGMAMLSSISIAPLAAAVQSIDCTRLSIFEFFS